MDFFKQAYNQNTYLDFLADKFTFSKSLSPIGIDNAEVKSFERLGTVTTKDDKTKTGKKLPVFEIYVEPNTQLQRNRVQLRNLVAKEIQAEHGALAVYIDDQNKQWRFSFIAIEYRLTDKGFGKDQTASKRFTYLLGENTQTRTADKQFATIDKQSTLEDLKQAFAVEPLNKAFYDDLYKWYETAQTQVVFPNDEHAENHTQTSLIRLLTRLLFIWFIKEKKLINADLFDKDKLQKLIHYDQSSSFYKAILQNLFFATLSTEIKNRDFRNESEFQGKNKDYGNQYRYRYHALVKNEEKWKTSFSQTPFLNGGLFESLDTKLSEYILDENGKPVKDKNGKEIINQQHKKLIDEWDKSIRPEQYAIRVDGFSDRSKNKLKFDNSLFFNADETGLIDLFKQYQFTVEESTPLDIEVALDPELLGKVFENLLASYNPETGQQARKATGSFYTPREIVSYMVDESIKACLLEKAPPHDGDTGFYKDRLQDLISLSDKTGELPAPEEVLIYPEEIPPLIKAISGIKIIDPAVGSGAFPMGLLQRMVALLVILDPHNEQWQRQKLAELPDLKSIEQDLKTSEQISDTKAKQQAQNILSAKKQQISDDFKQLDHNYLRKLYLIENCIYGVDIQPVAIQICKLRFFISLAIEQKPNKKPEDNFGIKPLPNLETKFVAANTLIGLENNEIESLFEKDDWQKITSDIEKIREDHFLESNRKKKQELIRNEKTLLNDLKKLLEKQKQSLIESEQQRINERVSQIPGEKNRKIQMKEEQKKFEIYKTEIDAKFASAQKIADWNPYNQNGVADWFDAEYMFGVKHGFDIVIGNPPYIQLQKDGGRLGSLYQNCNFKTFAKSGDIYQLFYERGMQLLTDAQGILAFITSNSWMRAQYGKKLRGFLSAEHSPLRLIDMGKNAFEAIVDTNILLASTGRAEQKFKAVDMDSIAEKQFPPAEQYWSEIEPADDVAWSILSPLEKKIKSRIEQLGTPLKDWDIRIYRGVLTGLNDAFIIDTAKRDELLAADPKSAEIIKPILRGRDVGRYGYKWAGKWLINSHNGDKNNAPINIDDYPAIKKHLNQYYPYLEKRQDKGITPYNLRNCAYLAEFEKEKLIWMHMSGNSRFSYSNGELYCNNKCFIVTGGQLKYLGALLNSKLVSWLMKVLGVPTGMGLIQWDKFTVETIPCVRLSQPEQQPFMDIVDQILTAKKSDKDTTALEAEIDKRVYQLYHLTADEIKIIEGEK